MSVYLEKYGQTSEVELRGSWGDLDGLERGAGGQGWVWRLTGRGLGEKSEKREGKVG